MGTGRIARVVNIVLGLWLFASAFVWPHTPAQMVNATLVGLFVALTGLAGGGELFRSRLHLINAALGAWLVVSIGAFPMRDRTTAINNAIVGVLVFLLALVPRGREPTWPRAA
jgi:hypothetical protein